MQTLTRPIDGVGGGGNERPVQGVTPPGNTSTKKVKEVKEYGKIIYSQTNGFACIVFPYCGRGDYYAGDDLEDELGSGDRGGATSCLI